MPSRYDTQRSKKTPPHVSLRDLRTVSGKTLDQVCEAASEELTTPLTRGSLSAIENGHRGVSTSVLRALEVAYGLQPGALVTNYLPRQRDLDLDAVSA